ncbi:MAG TPA: cytochrome c [Terracidiphilus sp.]|nr:cytochrome c [Terracidiphilus sp.]
MRCLPKRFVALIGLTAVAALAGCRSQPTLTPQQAEGKRVYEVGCAHCHENNDLALKKIPPNLHGLFQRKTLPDGAPATDAEVERVVMTGKGMMPSFAYQMTPEQMAALLAYLHTGLHEK